jgi:predicted MFS family arabinose efflux permease
MLLCGLTVIGAALLPFAIGTTWATWALFFVWGSTAYGIYTVSLIELGDRFSGSVLLAGNASFALMWGVGGMIGPPVFGLAMTGLGPHGLPLMMGLLYAALILVAVMRMPKRAAA